MEDKTFQTMNFQERVLYIVSLIPKGKVATYGQVTLLAGIPSAAQAVGMILHNAGYSRNLPFQRVLNQKGGLARGYTEGGVIRHKQEIEQDGVEVKPDFTVDLTRYLWQPDQQLLDQLALSLDLRIELAHFFHKRGIL